MSKQVISKKQMDAVKKQAEQAMAAAKAHLRGAEKKVVARIKKNPEQAVLIAAAVGAAVGAIATFSAMKGKKK